MTQDVKGDWPYGPMTCSSEEAAFWTTGGWSGPRADACSQTKACCGQYTQAPPALRRVGCGPGTETGKLMQGLVSEGRAITTYRVPANNLL